MAGSDEFGRWYDGAFYGRVVDPVLSGVHDFVASHLPDGDRVLEAACGTGSLAIRIARNGRRVVGVDRSARHIDYARENAAASDLSPDAVRFEIGDLRTVTLPPDGPYDVATIVFALHEMPQDVRLSVLERLSDVASQVMVVDFAAPMPWNLAGLKNRATELAAGWTHMSSFRDYQTRGGLDALVDQTGLVTLGDRTIDTGTLRVLTLQRPEGRERSRPT